MRTTTLLLASMIALLFAITGCDKEETLPDGCIELIQSDLIDASCVKCFEDDAQYELWFNKCWMYALIAGDGTDPQLLQQAADSLCACNL